MPAAWQSPARRSHTEARQGSTGSRSLGGKARKMYLINTYTALPVCQLRCRRVTHHHLLSSGHTERLSNLPKVTQPESGGATA